ncbi:C-terminal binding protein [Saliphagus sp. GCM10025334]
MTTILVTDYDFPDLAEERAVFEGTDVEIVEGQAKTAADVADLAAEWEADALLNQYAPVDATVFEAAPSVRVVARYGRGVDNVNVNDATDHGVFVASVPAYCTDEVSTHALALLLACQRNVVGYDRSIKSGTWDWTEGKPMRRLSSQRLGLVSFGGIARQLAERAQCLDLEVVSFDPYVDEDEMRAAGVEPLEFERLLETSDAVSVHAPLTEETHHLFDADAFAQMRETAYLVNTARGGLVDEDALADALEAGELAGAGLDVLTNEPPTDSPLVGREDVVLTPHVAWYSEDSRAELQRRTAENARDVLAGEVPEGVVNPKVTGK